MSFNLEGEKCPVCHAYFFEDEDIVFCPECGAPHHRDCYSAIGHCAYIDAHGTDLQYDKVKKHRKEEPDTENKRNNEGYSHTHSNTTNCKMCGEEFERSARSCPRCGAPNLGNVRGFAPFDLLGGVPADMDIGDGVTADEAKRFVAVNTPRYIPKFASFAAGKKVSWNWLAFFLPWVWFASRKMYLYSIIAVIFNIASVLVMNPFLMRFYDLIGVSTRVASEEAMSAINTISNQHPTLLILFLVGIAVTLIMRIICGLFSDGIYRKQVISSIKKIRSESEDQDEDYRKKGGVSFIAMLLAFFAGEYLPLIVAGFLI